MMITGTRFYGHSITRVKSKIVDRYEERIAFNFQEWQRAAHYIEPTIQKMLNDPKMFKH